MKALKRRFLSSLQLNSDARGHKGTLGSIKKEIGSRVK